MERVRAAALDGAIGRHERLRHHLSAEDPVAAVLRALPAKPVALERLEVEQLEQLLQLLADHGASSQGGAARTLGAPSGRRIHIDDPRAARGCRSRCARSTRSAVRSRDRSCRSIRATCSRPRARARGSHDYGDASFREPLAVLLDAFERDAKLSALGRISARGLVLQLLANRLRIEDLFRRHPEIERERIERPIIIAGLPRTGTTHLHNLISQDPSLRSLPYWESLEPVPDPREAPGAGRPRPARGALREGARAGPPRDAAVPADARDDRRRAPRGDPAARDRVLDDAVRVELLRAELCGLVQEERSAPGLSLSAALPPGACSGCAGPKRWVLKSPQHLEQQAALIEIFPDATFVQTHRDPVRITASLCTMIAYGNRMNARRVDPVAVGRYWAARTEDLLRGSIAGRAALPPAQVIDVHFRQFMKDDVATAERVLEFAGHPVSDDGARGDPRVHGREPARQARHDRLPARRRRARLRRAPRRAALLPRPFRRGRGARVTGAARPGRVALVTGGGGGIGRAVAERLAREGAIVEIAEIDAARGAEAAAAIAQQGGRAHAERLDVCEAGEVAAWIDGVLAREQRIDVLVNNVGHYLRSQPFAESDPEHWRALHRINLEQVFLVTRAALPALRAQRRGIDRERGLGRGDARLPARSGLRRVQGRGRALHASASRSSSRPTCA